MMLGLVVASRFAWHVLRLPVAFFTQRHAAELAGRVAVNEEVARLLSGDTATSALHLAAFGFFTAAMAAYDLTWPRSRSPRCCSTSARCR